MEFEKRGHEVLTVDVVTTGAQTATVRTHHALYALLQAAAPATIRAGADWSLAVKVVTWDTASLISDVREVQVFVNNHQTTSVTTVDGEANVLLKFEDPGTYTVVLRSDLVASATLEVTVQ